MKTLVLLIFLFLKINVFAQLSGTYTVGLPTDDYPTITAAITDLETNGMSGSVEFVINSGSYSELIITSVIPTSTDSLYIRSAANNQDSVVFEFGELIDCENVVLENLSFIKPAPADDNYLFRIHEGDNIMLNNCRISDLVNTYYSSSIGTMMIEHGIGTNYSFISCFISSLAGEIPLSNNEATIKETGNGNTFYYADTILGDWDTMLGYRQFINCYLVLGDGLREQGTTLIDSCYIEFYDYVSQGVNSFNQFYASSISNSTLQSVGILSVRFLSINNSIFDLPEFRVGATSDALIQNTTFLGEFRSVYRWNMKYARNEFKDYVYINSSGYADISNNFFYDTVSINGSLAHLIHNNFSSTSNLYYNSLGKVMNNNINSIMGAWLHALQTFESNNFFSTDVNTLYYSEFDVSPFYTNPNYTSPIDLHINNPTLYGMAAFVSDSEFNIDIDNEIRFEYRTIGADEKCLSLPFPDTIQVACGTIYPLMTCSSIDTSLYVWKPGAALFDSTAQYPVVNISGNTLVWLEDTLGNVFDSILFIPDSPIDGENETYYVNCGISMVLATQMPPNGSVIWSPTNVVSDSASNITYVIPDTSMIITATVDMGICGIKIDSFNIVVDPTPTAMYNFDSLDCKHGYFEALGVLCYDSLLWDFGDGTFSNQPIVSHNFPQDGFYTISLTIWHEGFSDNDTYLFYIPGCAGLEEPPDYTIKFYPNPTERAVFSDELSKLNGKITLVIFSVDGRNSFALDYVDDNMSIVLPTDGIYFISVYSNGNLIGTYKVVRI